MSSPVALVVLDGWGLAAPGPGNAVDLAETPVFDHIWTGCPHATLESSGRAVGFLRGRPGPFHDERAVRMLGAFAQKKSPEK